jgi:hypothetical protein
MGYHAGIANTNNLAEAIMMLPQMKGLAIEVRAETVKLGNKKTQKQENDKKDKDIKNTSDLLRMGQRCKNQTSPNSHVLF